MALQDCREIGQMAHSRCPHCKPGHMGIYAHEGSHSDAHEERASCAWI
jgi:hypothetical protein